MGKEFLIDTNALIDAQMNKLPAKGLEFMADIINRDFTVSFISYIEFLGYPDATKATENFIALADVIEVNKSVIDACINIRRVYRIKLPDAIIAASAIIYNLTLVTSNVSDFKNISGLTVINPHTV